MSTFKTKQELDERVTELRAMDSTALVTYVCDVFHHFQEARRTMQSDVDAIHEEYAMARIELERRLNKL